jgi:hypothetical protein
MRLVSRHAVVVVLLSLAACRDAQEPLRSDSSPLDTAPSADASKATACASVFGDALTDAFGRIDGTILAVVPAGHPTCPMPNGTHVVVQVTMNGAAYRMVVNLDVLTHAVDAPLAGEAWNEGWHPSTALDYVTTLGAHATDFDLNPSVESWITNQLDLGAHVSVFATSQNFHDSAHLVHRNATNMDGAIVVSPETSPHYLLFRFSNQSF